MTDRYENIRKALAMGPTPGPWDGDDNSVSRLWSNGATGIREYIALPDSAEDSAPNPANMHWIAACDPDTIRALLAKRDQLAAENARLREALEYIRIAMRLDPFDRLAELDNIHQIADAALSAAERADGRCR